MKQHRSLEEKLAILKLVEQGQNLLKLNRGAATEINQSSHFANIILNSLMLTASPRSTSAISSSISGVICSLPSTIFAYGMSSGNAVVFSFIAFTYRTIPNARATAFLINALMVIPAF